MSARAKILLFLSTFITPIPYLGMASVFGVRYLNVAAKRKNRIHLLIALNCSLVVGLILLSNQVNHVHLSYEEMKRLAALVCAFLSALYFIHSMKSPILTTLQQNSVLLFLALGWLACSRYFWKLPSSIQYQNYSWFKFAGASALIIVCIQLFLVSKYRNSISLWIMLGFSLAAYAVFNDAKSIAIHVLTLTFLRVGMLTEFTTGIRGTIQHLPSRYRLIRTLSLTLLVIIALIRSSQRGFFGAKISSLAEQYGTGLFGAIVRGRPELPYSIQIVHQLPFLGFGTVSDPFNHLRLQLISSTVLTTQEQHFLINRILTLGFNLHSWAFDVVVRGGFLCFIPIILYAVFLVRSIFSYDLIRYHPGLTYICIVSLEDLFFSPFSWFVSIQIGLTFLAIYMVCTESFGNVRENQK